MKTITGTFKLDGERYEWSATLCEDHPSLAVYLDLGNGKPECIGYADDAEEAADMVKDEIETLTA
jgi:hypothetical protein